MTVLGTSEVILAIRFTLPPGTPPEAAGKMLSQGGVNLPLGLIQNVVKVDVAVIKSGEPFICLPPETVQRV